MLFDKHWKKWIRKHNCKLANGTAALSKYSTLLMEEHVLLGHQKIKTLQELSIGAYTHIRSTGRLHLVKSIGRFCAISTDTYIGHEKYTHPLDWVSCHGIQYSEEFPLIYTPPLKLATIGHDVMMGINAIVMEGVNVGTGAIIGARSVVAKDIPPYAIVVGNPAKIIRYRFPEEICQGLLESQWWDYPIEVLKTLPMNKPAEFLKEISNIPREKAHYQTIKITHNKCKLLNEKN